MLKLLIQAVDSPVVRGLVADLQLGSYPLPNNRLGIVCHDRRHLRQVKRELKARRLRALKGGRQ